MWHRRFGQRKTVAKPTGEPKIETRPKKDPEWFDRKIAGLKTELDDLPADRQEQLKTELELEIEE